MDKNVECDKRSDRTDFEEIIRQNNGYGGTGWNGLGRDEM